MPVSATFSADFSQFVASTKNAEAALNNVAGSATRVGTHFQGLESGAGKASGQVNKLHGQLQAFDGVLRAVGVNLGPEISGLSDLASASGKTAAQLGGVAVTGLAVGAAVGGWKIGRAISEFFDLDTTIGNATAKLLGWGDAAGQAAAAKADVLARASANAGYKITDMAMAIEINRQALVGHVTQAGISAAATKSWQAEIDRVQSAGDLPSLTADLKSQNFTLADLAARYHVSVQAIQAFTREQDNAAKAVTEANAKIEANNKRLFDQTARDTKRLQDEFDLKKKITDETVALAADAAMEEVLAHGTASEIIKKQNHEVYLAKLADLVANKTDTKANLAAIAAFEDAANAHDQVNQQTLHTGRLKDAQDLAAMEQRTLAEMIAHADQYTRGALQAQVDKVRELNFALTAAGRAGVEAQDSAAEATKKHTAELEKQLVLIGRLTPGNNEFGGSFNVTASNLRESVGGLMGPGLGLSTAYATNAFGGAAEGLAGEGYSFEEILGILRGGKKYKPIGPRIPGFAGGVDSFGGGLAMVGERGPELVNLPSGSGVIPLSGRGGVSIVVNQYITGVIDHALARKLADVTGAELMARLSLGRQLGAG